MLALGNHQDPMIAKLLCQRNMLETELKVMKKGVRGGTCDG